MNSIIQPVFEVLLFITAVLLAFYLPGRFITKFLKLKLNFLEGLFFNTSLGLANFTLFAYILSFANASFLITPLLLIFALINLRTKLKLPTFETKNLRHLLLLLVMILVFSLTMITSGQFGETINLVGTNRQDSVWHLSLINELKAHFPPDNPGFSEISLQGYHFFYNFLLAKISDIFLIPILPLYFQFFPLLISFLWALGVYVLMLRWTNNKGVAFISVFLTLFGGSFSFILTLAGYQNISLDDAFGMTQPAGALLNPPFSISVVLLITSIFSLLLYFKTRKNNWLIPLIILAGIITMFKVYAGMILLGAFAILTLRQVFKKNYAFVFAFISSLIIFAGTYWIFRDPSSKLFFAPLWSPHRVIEANFPAFGFTEKYETYLREGVLRGLITVQAFALVAFIVGSMGTRIIGLIYLVPLILKNKFSFSPFVSSLILMTMISLLVPLFFIQSGKVFEIIQMTWYFLFFSSLFAAFGLYKLFNRRNKILAGTLILTFILLTLPSALEKLSGYVVPGEVISKDYLEATKFLKNQGSYESTVLELPVSSYYVGINTAREDIRSWYENFSSPRLLAFSNKRGFVNNQFINFSNTDADSRLEVIISILKFEKFPQGSDFSKQEEIAEVLKTNNIFYIYSPLPLLRLEKANIIQKIFENKETNIYKVSI